MSRRPNIAKSSKSSTGGNVGYGKPPQHSQFKKNQSGNPNGRPKGSKNKPKSSDNVRFSDEVRAAGNRKVPVRSGGEVEHRSVNNAIVQATAKKAVEGNVAAQRLWASEMHQKDKIDNELEMAVYKSAMHYIPAWNQEYKRLDELNISEPEILPPASTVIPNPVSGTVDVRGPMTPLEFDEWVFWKMRRTAFVECLECIEQVGSSVFMDTYSKYAHQMIYIFDDFLQDGRCYCESHLFNERQRATFGDTLWLQNDEFDLATRRQLSELCRAYVTLPEIADVLLLDFDRLSEWIDDSTDAADQVSRGAKQGAIFLRRKLRQHADENATIHPNVLLNHFQQEVTKAEDPNENRSKVCEIVMEYPPKGSYYNGEGKLVTVPELLAPETFPGSHLEAAMKRLGHMPLDQTLDDGQRR